MLAVGIIGAGIMGERMLRAALDHAADVVRVVAVWDRDPAALDRIAAILPGGTRASAAEAVIEASDCVYVATPPGTHLAYAEQAFDAGRAVFLEKPLAVDVPAAEDFVRRHATDRAAVNFPFASSLAVERLRGWMADAPPPAAFAIEAGFARWPRPWQHGAASWLAGAAEGGFTREVLSHFLFLSRRLLGELSLQSAELDRPQSGSERRIAARLTAGGVPGQVHGAVGETDKDDHNTWTLPEAGLRLRDWSIAERRDEGGAWIADPDALPNERMRPLVLRRQLEQVVRMTDGEPHGLATLQEALDVQRIVEAMLAGPS